MEIYPDTNVLMTYANELFSSCTKVLIAGVVLEELDKLKESSDGEKAFRARNASRIIEKNIAKVEFYIKEGSFSLPLYLENGRYDNKIISIYKDLYTVNNEILAVSNDLLFRLKCKSLGLPCEQFLPGVSEGLYSGYKIIDLTADELARWYSSEISANIWDLEINQYGLLRLDGEIVDKLKRTTKGVDTVKYKQIQTTFCGKIKPRNIQQELAFDMLQDTSTHYKCLIGKFGTGKDYIMINMALQLLEEHKYDKIIWVVQNQQVKNTRDIGALPGDLSQKLIPFTNILSDKLGGQFGLDVCINNRQIEVAPLAFLRGREFNKSIVMISEAENITKEHMQLIMSRMGEKSILMVNGDFKQVDNNIFEQNSGLLAFINSLKGHEEFGYVMLDKTERSKLAEMSSLLD
jgi:PhoH-like ATPase